MVSGTCENVPFPDQSTPVYFNLYWKSEGFALFSWDSLNNACISNGQGCTVDGGPTCSPGESLLVSDPPDVGAGIGKYVD